MHIYGPSSVHGPHSIAPSQASRPARAAEASEPARPRDEVEISQMGQLLESLSNVSEMRFERIQQIRTQIANGTYDNEARLNVALDRLLDEIA